MRQHAWCWTAPGSAAFQAVPAGLHRQAGVYQLAGQRAPGTGCPPQADALPGGWKPALRHLPRGRLALLASLFAALLVVLLVAGPGQGRLPPLTVYSAEPSGGRALWLWLRELAYDVSTVERTPYKLDDRARTVLVLAPTVGFGGADLDELEQWTKRGGTLIVAGEDGSTRRVLERFGLGLDELADELEMVEPAPGAGLDPAIREVAVDTRAALVGRSAALRPLLVAGERTVAAELAVGSGRLLALSSDAALSNRALRREDNARLALWLIGPARRGPVAVDELHHGYAANQRSLTSLVFDHAWGRAALLAGGVVFVYLALRGRRFGRARPVLVTRGRSLSEYVTSLAGLYRAGGKRAFIAEHFQHHLRREYARRLGLPGDATDDQLEARARALRRDPTSVLEALRALQRGGRLGEAELARLVREAEEAVGDGLRILRP